MINNLLCGDAFEIEALATREYCGQHFMYISGRHYKDGMWWRFLQRLEQSIESFRGEHMRFVKDIDLVLTRSGRHHNLLAQITDTIDTAIGGRIDLNHIK